MFKWIGKRLAVIAQPIFYQSLPIHNYLSCFCNYFLIDFVSEVFIIKVTVKENSFKHGVIILNKSSNSVFLYLKIY